MHLIGIELLAQVVTPSQSALDSTTSNAYYMHMMTIQFTLTDI